MPKGLDALAEIAESKPLIKRWIDDKSLPILLDHLLAFIAHYQKANSGQTPTVSAMANELMVSDQRVRFYLNLLERDGRLHRFGQNPIRIMLKDSPPPLDVARRVTGALKTNYPRDGTKRERYESVDAKRQQLGRFIGETWRKEKRAPTLREMMDYADTTSPGWVQAQLEILRDRGLLDPHKTALSPQGEQVYGLTKEEEDVNSSTRNFTDAALREKAMAAARVTNEKRWAKHRAEQDAKALDFIRQYIAKNGKSPNMAEVAVGIGLSKHAANASPVLKRLEAQGKIRRGFHKPGIELVGEASQPTEKKHVVVVTNRGQKGSRDPQGALLKWLGMLHRDIEKFGMPKSAEEYAEELGYTSGAINHMTRRLEEYGWATRRTKFLVTLRLTERGEAVYRERVAHEEPEQPTETEVQPEPQVTVPPPPQPEAGRDEMWREGAEFLREREHNATYGSGPMEADVRPGIWRRAVSSGAMPTREFGPSKEQMLRSMDDASLVLELIERGYVVRRS